VHLINSPWSSPKNVRFRKFWRSYTRICSGSWMWSQIWPGTSTVCLLGRWHIWFKHLMCHDFIFHFYRAENCCTVCFSVIKFYNLYIAVFYISKVVRKVTAYAASDYGTTDAQINKSYFNSIHFHRSNTRSPMKIILRVGEIFCRISPY